jgi:endonuclease YncB( thermonuclease family)
MRITSAFTTHLALAGAAYSSSGMCLPRIEVRDHLTLRFTKPITTNNIQRDAGLKGKTIHIRMAGMDAPEVSETGIESPSPLPIPSRLMN